MKHNMGNLDRALRVIYGIGVLLVGWFSFDTAEIFRGVVRAETVGGLVISLIGLALFLTGVLAYCPINALIHANSCSTCKTGETHSHKPV